MALKPPIDGSKPYEIHYAADADSSGVALIAVLFAPRDGKPVPEPSEMFVAAGTDHALDGTSPGAAEARRMEVLADLPDFGSGTLTVSVDGQVVSSESITEDVSWKFVIR